MKEEQARTSGNGGGERERERGFVNDGEGYVEKEEDKI